MGPQPTLMSSLTHSGYSSDHDSGNGLSSGTTAFVDRPVPAMFSGVHIESLNGLLSSDLNVRSTESRRTSNDSVHSIGNTGAYPLDRSSAAQISSSTSDGFGFGADTFSSKASINLNGGGVHVGHIDQSTSGSGYNGSTQDPLSPHSTSISITPRRSFTKQEVQAMDPDPKHCNNCKTMNTPSWRRCPDGRILLCNACGLYQKLHGKPRPFFRARDGTIKIHRTAQDHRPCALCQITVAPIWHKNEQNDSLCNACYLLTRKRNSYSSSQSTTVAPEPLLTPAMVLAAGGERNGENESVGHRVRSPGSKSNKSKPRDSQSVKSKGIRMRTHQTSSKGALRGNPVADAIKRYRDSPYAASQSSTYLNGRNISSGYSSIGGTPGLGVPTMATHGHITHHESKDGRVETGSNESTLSSSFYGSQVPNSEAPMSYTASLTSAGCSKINGHELESGGCMVGSRLPSQTFYHRYHPRHLYPFQQQQQEYSSVGMLSSLQYASQSSNPGSGASRLSFSKTNEVFSEQTAPMIRYWEATAHSPRSNAPLVSPSSLPHMTPFTFSTGTLANSTATSTTAATALDIAGMANNTSIPQSARSMVPSGAVTATADSAYASQGFEPSSLGEIAMSEWQEESGGTRDGPSLEETTSDETIHARGREGQVATGHFTHSQNQRHTGSQDEGEEGTEDEGDALEESILMQGHSEVSLWQGEAASEAMGHRVEYVPESPSAYGPSELKHLTVLPDPFLASSEATIEPSSSRDADALDGDF
ncbi:Transcription factor GATA-5 [Lunasporangiospora selenospora]|uniref:Transcription factor GATA-5 n=1 Tax=Lunasporangiospora selenospora TaxID=979761 RepID=A0A9P6FYI6_9FUNG|nr:Transcription factor GATA-5 [Lunasporangiospora selenospora]